MAVDVFSFQYSFTVGKFNNIKACPSISAKRIKNMIENVVRVENSRNAIGTFFHNEPCQMCTIRRLSKESGSVVR